MLRRRPHSTRTTVRWPASFESRLPALGAVLQTLLEPPPRFLLKRRESFDNAVAFHDVEDALNALFFILQPGTTLFERRSVTKCFHAAIVAFLPAQTKGITSMRQPPHDGGCGGMLFAVRYEKLLRLTPRSITPGRLQAAERALKHERQNRPRLATQIAEEQPTPKDRIQAIDAQYHARWQAIRDQAAHTWRAARRILHALPEDEQRQLLTRWNAAPYPGRSEYFADFIRQQTKPSSPAEADQS